MARKEAAATVEWGPWGGGTRREGTPRTADPEPRVSGRLPGTEAVHTGRESELPRQNPCQGARSARSKAGVREEAWPPGVAQGVLVCLGPEQRCRKLRLMPDSAKKWENHPVGHSLQGVAGVTLRRQFWLQSRSEEAEPLGKETMVHKLQRGFPGGASGKEPACQCRRLRDLGSIPGLGRPPEGGHGNPLQYSYLENPMEEPDGLQSMGSQSQTILKWLNTHTSTSTRGDQSQTGPSHALG